MTFRAEYLWIDGNEPTGEIRTKTKILNNDESPPIWGFDGSSTNQATGDRGASVRIPWQVARDGKGYIEDRRPNANADPYEVTTLLTRTICEALVGYD